MVFVRVRTAKDSETLVNGNCGGRLLLNFLRDKLGLTTKDPELDLADDSGNLQFLTKLSPTCNSLQVLTPRAVYLPVLIAEKPKLKFQYLVKTPTMTGPWKSRGALTKLQNHWDKFHKACAKQGGKFANDENAIAVILRLGGPRPSTGGRLRGAMRSPSLSSINRDSPHSHDNTSDRSNEGRTRWGKAPLGSDHISDTEEAQADEEKTGSERSRRPTKRERSRSSERGNYNREEQTSDGVTTRTIEELDESEKPEKGILSRYVRPQDANEPKGGKLGGGNARKAIRFGQDNPPSDYVGPTLEVCRNNEMTESEIIDATKGTASVPKCDKTHTGSGQMGSEMNETLTGKEFAETDRASAETQDALNDRPGRMSKNAFDTDEKGETAAQRMDYVEEAEVKGAPEGNYVEPISGITSGNRPPGDHIMNSNPTTEVREAHESCDVPMEDEAAKERDRIGRSEATVLANMTTSEAQPGVYSPSGNFATTTAPAGEQTPPRPRAGSAGPPEVFVAASGQRHAMGTQERPQSDKFTAAGIINPLLSPSSGFTVLNADQVRQNHQLSAQMAAETALSHNSCLQLTISGVEVHEGDTSVNETPAVRASNAGTCAPSNTDEQTNTGQPGSLRVMVPEGAFEQNGGGPIPKSGAPWSVRDQLRQSLTGPWSNMGYGVYSDLGHSQINASKDKPPNLVGTTSNIANVQNQKKQREDARNPPVSLAEANNKEVYRGASYRAQPEPTQRGKDISAIAPRSRVSSTWRSSHYDEIIDQTAHEASELGVPPNLDDSDRYNAQHERCPTGPAITQELRQPAGLPANAATSFPSPKKSHSSDSLEVQYNPPSSLRNATISSTADSLNANLRELDRSLQERRQNACVSVVNEPENTQLGNMDCSKRIWEREVHKVPRSKTIDEVGKDAPNTNQQRYKLLKENKPEEEVADISYERIKWREEAPAGKEKITRVASAKSSYSDSAVPAFMKTNGSQSIPTDDKKRGMKPRRIVRIEEKHDEISNNGQVKTGSRLQDQITPSIAFREDTNVATGQEERDSVRRERGEPGPRITQETPQTVKIDKSSTNGTSSANRGLQAQKGIQEDVSHSLSKQKQEEVMSKGIADVRLSSTLMHSKSKKELQEASKSNAVQTNGDAASSSQTQRKSSVRVISSQPKSVPGSGTDDSRDRTDARRRSVSVPVEDGSGMAQTKRKQSTSVSGERGSGKQRQHIKLYLVNSGAGSELASRARGDSHGAASLDHTVKGGRQRRRSQSAASSEKGEIEPELHHEEDRQLENRAGIQGESKGHRDTQSAKVSHKPRKSIFGQKLRHVEHESPNNKEINEEDTDHQDGNLEKVTHKRRKAIFAHRSNEQRKESIPNSVSIVQFDNATNPDEISHKSVHARHKNASPHATNECDDGSNAKETAYFTAGGKSQLVGSVDSELDAWQENAKKSTLAKNTRDSAGQNRNKREGPVAKPTKGKDATKSKIIPPKSKLSKVPRKSKNSKDEGKATDNEESTSCVPVPEKPKPLSSATLLKRVLKCRALRPPPEMVVEDQEDDPAKGHKRRSSARKSQKASAEIVLLGSISAADLAARVSMEQLTQEERDQYQIQPGIWMVAEKIA